MKAIHRTIAFAVASLTSSLPLRAQVPDQLKLSIPAPPVGAQVGAGLGYSVAVDGPFTVVGAPQDNTGVQEAGVVKVFNSTTGSLLFVLPSPADPDGTHYYFGTSVSISDSRLVVPYVGDSTAYVYDLAGSTPTVPAATLRIPLSASNGERRFSVASSGTRVVVGDGASIVAGAWGAGSAYVYDLAGATPAIPTVTFNNPNPAGSGQFGNAVAISDARIAVGAIGANTAATVTGIAYVYELGSATPAVPVITLYNPNLTDGNGFGSSIAIHGTRVIVGAPYDSTGATGSGAAYLYDLSSATPAVPVLTLMNPAPGNGTYFGFSVAISGTRIVVGTFGNDINPPNVGSAYVYDTGSRTPTVPVASLNSPSPAAYDLFGWSVAIDGTTIAIGTPYDDSPQTDKGAAYIFGPSPYSLWKVSELSNQFASDLGDDDRDGLSNLGEYGLLRSPLMPNGAATSAVPALYPEGTRLRMFVPRDPARNDVTLEVQATGDLNGTWTTVATSTLGAPFTGPGYFSGDAATPGVKSVEVRDTVNVTDAPKRFLRVRVRH